jgi:peptidoglycan/xylan/chitin deacetylase (PgdA/CDA1 family)
MRSTRILRNFTGWILGKTLIATGSIEKILHKIDSEELIIPMVFHNPSQNIFNKCIKWLINNQFEFLSSNDLYKILSNHTKPSKRLAWITIDDGWSDNLQNVIPILQKYNIPATIFVSPKCIEEGFYWFSIARKYKYYLPIKINKLWKIENSKRKKIINDLIEQVIQNFPREVITPDELIALSKYSIFTVGNHTNNHVICPRCTSKELDSEIFQANSEIEKIIRKKPKYFAYPNGEYSVKSIEILKKNHIIMAATTKERFMTKHEDVHLIPRMVVMDDGSFEENLCHMLGIWQPFISRMKSLIHLNNYKLK